MIAISNNMPIFAASYISKERDTASTLRAGFLCPSLCQYWHSTPSSSVNAPAAPCECMTEGQAVPLLFPQPNKQISVNVIHRTNLFASEEQYLTSNARRSEIRRILTQPLSQRATSLRTAIRFHHRIALSRSYQSPFQENRTVLPAVGKTEPTQLPRQRLHSTERRAQLPLIIQLPGISASGIIQEAWSPCGQTKKQLRLPRMQLPIVLLLIIKSIFL